MQFSQIHTFHCIICELCSAFCVGAEGHQRSNAPFGNRLSLFWASFSLLFCCQWQLPALRPHLLWEHTAPFGQEMAGAPCRHKSLRLAQIQF